MRPPFTQVEENRQSIRYFVYEFESGKLYSLPQFVDVRDEGDNADGRELVDDGDFPYQQLPVYRWQALKGRNFVVLSRAIH